MTTFSTVLLTGQGPPAVQVPPSLGPAVPGSCGGLHVGGGGQPGAATPTPVGPPTGSAAGDLTRRGSAGIPKVEAAMTFTRITHNPAVMGGKPCIRGMRVTVGMIVGQIGAGHTIEELLADYPYLEREDILQALRYAAWLAEDREVVLPGA